MVGGTDFQTSRCRKLRYCLCTLRMHHWSMRENTASPGHAERSGDHHEPPKSCSGTSYLLFMRQTTWRREESPPSTGNGPKGRALSSGPSADLFPMCHIVVGLGELRPIPVHRWWEFKVRGSSLQVIRRIRRRLFKDRSFSSGSSGCAVLTGGQAFRLFVRPSQGDRAAQSLPPHSPNT
jgi:hypothetical protein